MRLVVLSLIAASAGLVACATETAPPRTDADELVSKKDDHWFYAGPLPMLENPHVTASIAGHTAHVTGTLPPGTRLPNLPHVKTKPEGGRLRVDVVYPIATARPGKSNSRPGTYAFEKVIGYRPDGNTYTEEEGNHWVTWGGFPFFAYNGGIAFHGPITAQDNEAPGDLSVWYLQRGDVSGGCNRMMGEHIVEMTHILGVNMRKIYSANERIRPTTTASVEVVGGYDTYDGKYVDVDYPTYGSAKRPGTIYGAENVAMFGSWVASEMPNGKDLPPDMKWEGGVSGVLYDFQEHAVQGNVCSMPKASLPALKSIAARTGGVLPESFCAQKIACDAGQGRLCAPAEIGL